MNVPSGYSALDLVGFTDKGDYSPSATYVKNDLVHYNDKIWKCLIDDTTGIVPTTGVNWDIWINQSTSLDGLTDVEITSPTDGQEVTYDATTQKWKNTSKFQTLTNQVKDMNNVLGAKNLLPNQALDDTWKGITWKVNSDGTLSASGTAEANSIRTIVEAFEIPVGKYILNGCPSGSGLSSYYLDLSVVSGTVTPNYGNDIGEGLAFEVTQTAKITVKARVLSGQTVDIVFKPMIRLASIIDDTYVPYAKSNRELTEDVEELSTLVAEKMKKYAIPSDTRNLVITSQTKGNVVKLVTNLGELTLDVAGNNFRVLGKLIMNRPALSSGNNWTYSINGQTITINTANTVVGFILARDDDLEITTSQTSTPQANTIDVLNLYELSNS